MSDTTLVLIKPDAVQRGIVGEIISRFEQKGLTILGLKLVVPSRSLVECHYDEHTLKQYFNEMVDTLQGRPLIAVAIQGVRAQAVVRRMIGHTSNCRNCLPGTIRGDLGMSGRFTVVHASDSPESAKREVSLWFKSHEVCRYDRATLPWTETSMDLNEENVNG